MLFMMTNTAANEITWSKRPVLVRAGEYTAKAKVTEWVSEDGRFTIVKTGHMAYRRERGCVGNLSYRWIWTGYRLTDHSPERPSYLPEGVTRPTVADCKRIAASRI